MAGHTNTRGFAEGFTSGFGLVNRVQQQRADQDFRRDQLAAQQQRDEATAAFRQQQLENTAEQNRLTAEFRSQQLAGQQAEKAAADANRLEMLGIERSKLDAMTNPENPTYKKQMAEADNINAQASERKAKARVTDRYADRIQYAENLNLGTMLALKPELTDQQKLDFAKLVAANEGTAFDFGEISDYVGGEVATDVSRYLQTVAQGGDPTMSPQVARSFSRALKLKDTAAMGRTIDENFENAPDHLKDGNYVIVDQGLYQPKLSQDGSISGQMYVIARNTTTGEEEPYFAPITDNRVSIGGQASTFTVDEVAKVSASQIQMRDQLAPIVRQRTREAKILTKFGDIGKMDSGVEAFNNTVNQELDRVIRGLQGGGTPSGLQLLVSPEMAAELRGEQLTPSQTNMLRQRIEDNILFGTTATPPQFGVGQWLQNTKAELQDVPLPSAPKGSKYQRDASFVLGERERGRDEARTLGDLINIDELPEETVSKLNGLFDAEGNIRNARLYIQTMNELGFLVER